jgi:predicted kinase
MPTVHLVCGPVGAGKTTYAMRLARKRSAVHFAIDDWMSTLFWPDAPKPASLAWALEHTRRCDRQVLRVCAELARIGVDAVADLGFMKREHRESFSRDAGSLGFQVLLHVVQADLAERRQRVQRRNTHAQDVLSVEVPDDIFDWAETWYEAPAADELVGAIVVKG